MGLFKGSRKKRGRGKGSRAALGKPPPLQEINADKPASCLVCLRWASEPHRHGGNTGECKDNHRIVETQGWKGPTRSSSPSVLLSPMLPPKMSGNSFREVMGRSEVSARRGWLPKCARPRLTVLAACAGRKAPPRAPSGRCCSLPQVSPCFQIPLPPVKNHCQQR